ncbi:MAG TPA: YsnF/AvaK domain-containing protein, partial [Armatimonadota bacterium]|nr:YsnF/AvaK domain-containing protein [Armatimonadota bacterium]
AAGEAGGGLASGLGVGAGVGALFGLAALLIPGGGPLIAAGPLAAALGVGAGTVAAGAIVGGAAGGLAGALSHWGLSEAEAHHYAGEVERGGTYVGVDLDRSNVGREGVLSAFRSHNGRIQDAPSTGTASAPVAGAATATTGFTSGGATTMAADRTPGYTGHDTTEEVRVPVMEETADVHKVSRQTGEMEITKRVETEMQHISEPVTRERVSVDVRPATDATVTDASRTLEPGESIRVPIYEEELVVDKQTRVTGEAVITRERETEQVTREVPLRHERVEVNELNQADTVDDLSTNRRV